ncbi:hypothetical protein BPOR_0154g00170 [Botrytis porri]|uniref:Uncharacterized protein n=1 Tax=Botrytis porri TaxID=87229 RepID=A0A4Z1KVN8_9HELO|nr:hypothetical protein BPOR_0154g00170 [Botrytis porri]
MPLEAISMDEDRACRGNMFIIVDQECEVGHRFVRAISRYLEDFLRGLEQGGGIDIVDADVVFGAEGREPGGVAIGGDVGDDQSGFGGGGETGTETVGCGEGGLAGSVGIPDACPGE